jgi:tetratricopeptide (TPR) repeat protein
VPSADLDAVVAELSVVMAHLLWRGGAYLESASVAARGSERARVVGDTRLLAEAEFRRGTALTHAGDFEHGVPAIEEAIARAEAAGDLDTASRAMGNLALFHWDRGEIRPARALMLRALELSLQANDPTRVAANLGDLAAFDFTMGEWQSARAHLDGAEQSLQGVDAAWIRPRNTVRRVALCLAQGEIAEGLRLVEAGLDLAEQGGNLTDECEAAHVLCDQALFFLETRSLPGAICSASSPGTPGIQEEHHPSRPGVKSCWHRCMPSWAILHARKSI